MKLITIPEISNKQCNLFLRKKMVKWTNRSGQTNYSTRKVLSALTDVWFQAKRQFNFLQGQMDAGEGVAFELEGTDQSGLNQNDI